MVEKDDEGSGSYYGSTEYVARASAKILNQLKEQVLPKFANIRDGEKVCLQKCEPAKAFTFFMFKPIQKTINLQKDDMVAVWPDKNDKPLVEQQSYFIGIVDTIRIRDEKAPKAQDEESVVVIKTIINPSAAGTPDQMARVNGLIGHAELDSLWCVGRIFNLGNQAKNFLAVQTVKDLPIKNAFISPHAIEPLPFEDMTLPKYGMQMIEGDFKSGKTSLVPKIVKCYTELVEEFHEQKRLSQLPKKDAYELSDESDDDDPKGRMNHFPWFKKDYQVVYDDLARDKTVKQTNYPKASVTDQKIELKAKPQMDFGMQLDQDGEDSLQITLPKRFLILTASNSAADNVLQQFQAQKTNLDGLVRLSQSARHNDLNDKFAIDRLAGIDVGKNSKQKGKQGEEAVARAKILDPKRCQVLVSPVQNLLSSGGNRNMLDKYFHSLGNEIDPKVLKEHLFDTVIVDDASLVSEADLIWAALRYGCQRLILLGNDKLTPDTFSIGKEATVDNTLWTRAAKALAEKTIRLPPVMLESIPEIIKLQCESALKRKKSSYIDALEARSILTYYHDELQMSEYESVAIVSLFRTQATCIRDELQAMVKEFEQGASKLQFLQETKKKKRSQKFVPIDRIDPVEDFVSCDRHFDVILVSLCFNGDGDPMPRVLCNEAVLDLLKSICRTKLIVFGDGYRDKGETVWHKLD